MGKNFVFFKQFYDFYTVGSSPRVEIFGGITSFLAASYILLVNPQIMAQAGIPLSAATTATVLLTIVGTCISALWAKSPFILSTGMSLNVLFANLVTYGRFTLPELFGCLLYAGIGFTALLMLDTKQYLQKAIPTSLRIGFGAGIGALIVFTGLKTVGFIMPSTASGALQIGSISNPVLITFFCGMAITLFLVMRHIPGSFVLGIAASTLIALPLGRWYGTEMVVRCEQWFRAPDFSYFGQLDMSVILAPRCWPIMMLLLCIMFFDAFASTTSVAEAGNLLDGNGNPPFLRKNLFCAAVSAIMAGFVGSTPPALFIESAVGVRAGARTGLAALTAAVLTIPFLFFAPVLSLIPSLALAPVLIIAGAYMLKPLLYIRWERYEDAIPVFFCLFLMPTTQSIKMGISWGIITWTAINIFGGELRKINFLMYLFTVVAVIMLIMNNYWLH